MAILWTTAGAGAWASGGALEHPWTDPARALVLDPYFANRLDFAQLARERRVVGIVHKATIGTSKVDPGYFKRKQEAKARGYLWGSYHWGVRGNPEKQADFYIDSVKPADDELIALDLEDASGSNGLMNADEALRFVARVRERTGRYPVLYTNHASTLALSKSDKYKTFGEMPLWYARFKSVVTDFPTGRWPAYTLWQFSSEILPQLAVPGTNKDMDVNVFDGTPDQLRAAWPLTKKVAQ
jgi:GH25 family lysozyme M1 (1,4-beta-N-acetylmuramidase)